MTRRCSRHGGLVLDGDAQVIGSRDTGSGPAVPVYACRTCIHTEGIIPPRPTAAPPPTAGRLSAECTMAMDMHWEEQHDQCATRGCGCHCHASRPAFIGHRDTAPSFASQEDA